MHDSRVFLQKTFHVPSNSFCYPSSLYNDAVIAAVKRAGYTNAVTEGSCLRDERRPLPCCRSFEIEGGVIRARRRPARYAAFRSRNRRLGVRPAGRSTDDRCSTIVERSQNLMKLLHKWLTTGSQCHASAPDIPARGDAGPRGLGSETPPTQSKTLRRAMFTRYRRVVGDRQWCALACRPRSR